MPETTMSAEELDDLAYGIVLDHLLEGPEYIAIAETVEDEGGYDGDTEQVAVTVRLTLTELARTFNIHN